MIIINVFEKLISTQYYKDFSNNQTKESLEKRAMLAKSHEDLCKNY